MLGQIRREKNTLLSWLAFVFFRLSKRKLLFQIFLTIPRSIRLHLSFKLYLFQLSSGLYFRFVLLFFVCGGLFLSLLLYSSPRETFISLSFLVFFLRFISQVLSSSFFMIRKNAAIFLLLRPHLNQCPPSAIVYCMPLFFLLIQSNLFQYKVLPSVSTSQGQR